MKKYLFILLLIFCVTVISSQTTVTKTYSGGTVSVDGSTVTLPGVVFTAADFPNVCEIQNVSVNIIWTKTGGGNCNSQSSAFAFHNETGFTISAPAGGNVALAPTGTWSGGTNIGNVNTTFNNTGGSPSGTPVSGSFGASGSLASYNGNNPIGTWNLIATDTANQDPLCIISYSVTITAQDTTPPITPTVAAETFECSGTPTAPTTTDVCDTSTITGTTTTTFPITTLGNTTVTWTFTDASGNSTTADQVVTVQDTTPPVTPTVAAETFECSGTPTTPTTTDVCDTSTITGTTTTPFPITTLGNTTVTWTFTDASGNSTTADQVVTITSCVADLSLTKTVDNAIVKIGDTIIFTLRLTNNGPERAFGVQVTDVLPSSLMYDVTNSTIPVNTTYNSIADIWDLSSVAITVGQTIELKIAAIVSSAGIINNISEVIQNNQSDPDSTPNSGN